MRVSQSESQKFNEMFNKMPAMAPKLDERFSVEHKGKTVEVVYDRQNGMVCFHFGKQSRRFKQKIGDLVASYFGTTDNFEYDYTPELNCHSVYGKQLLNLPMFNKAYHVEGFVKHVIDNLGS